MASRRRYVCEPLHLGDPQDLAGLGWLEALSCKHVAEHGKCKSASAKKGQSKEWPVKAHGGRFPEYVAQHCNRISRIAFRRLKKVVKSYSGQSKKHRNYRSSFSRDHKV